MSVRKTQDASTFVSEHKGVGSLAIAQALSQLAEFFRELHDQAEEPCVQSIHFEYLWDYYGEDEHGVCLTVALI